MNQSVEIAPCKNRLLARLSAGDADLIGGDLRPVVLEVDQQLEVPQKPVEEVYFPESGIASIVAVQDRGSRIEAGLFGRDGMSGCAVVMADGKSPHEVFMQVGGAGYCIASSDLRRAMARSETLMPLLLRFVQALWVQTAHTALSNARWPMKARLARWLLMCHDRVEGDELHLTHDFLSLMLGARRSTVTDGIHILEGEKLIRASRGRIIIRDRDALEKLAGGSYGVPEAEYRRLIG